eukprot:6966199-Ditylum_brightwellii.AAC.1
MRLSTWKSEHTKSPLPPKTSSWSSPNLQPWPKPSSLPSRREASGTPATNPHPPRSILQRILSPSELNSKEKQDHQVFPIQHHFQSFLADTNPTVMPTLNPADYRPSAQVGRDKEFATKA